MNVEADVGTWRAGMLLTPESRNTGRIVYPMQKIGGRKIATVRENATGTILGSNSDYYYKQVAIVDTRQTETVTTAEEHDIRRLNLNPT